MTTKYDPSECERLCGEARDRPAIRVGSTMLMTRQIVDDRQIIAALADQLAAARAEVERLDKERDDTLDLARKINAERNAMRPIVEVTEQWRDHVYRGRVSISDGVRICDAPIIFAVDGYRAARDKAGT